MAAEERQQRAFENRVRLTAEKDERQAKQAVEKERRQEKQEMKWKAAEEKQQRTMKARLMVPVAIEMDSAAKSKLPSVWASCDKCDKWRRMSSMPSQESWYCEDNPDTVHNHC